VIFFLGALIQAGIGPRPALGEETASIVFLTWKPNQPEIWQRLIKGFEARHPGIRVQVQVGPHSSTDYHAILTQRLKNRDPSVDVFFMDVIWPPEFASAGWALDLSSRFAAAEREPFLRGPVTALTYGGKIYGVPCYVAAGLLYYREDLLKKYHLSPPCSWEEMLEQGRTIRKGEGGSGLYIYSAQFKQYEGLVCNVLEFIRSNGGRVLDPESGRGLLAEQAVREAIAFVRDQIVGNASPLGVVNYEEPESLDLFLQGKAVFHRNWPYAWDVANDPGKSRVAGRVGVGALPAFPGKKPVSTLGGWQFGISRWSRHQEDAWRFVRFMTSEGAQKTLAVEASLAPARRAIYEDPEVMEKKAHLKALLPALEAARPRPLSPVYPMISQELQRFFSQAIVQKGFDYPGMAAKASERIERLYRMGASIKP
ncbi:MAG: ABC transporter substrate-binding protein, partial [Deltaproteobacteria bacterium]|nr:ABC transporter substrate-binding protein [Deltaproteobacteria bacterium]